MDPKTLEPLKGETAAQMKERIADVQRELDREAAARATPPTPPPAATPPPPPPAQVPPAGKVNQDPTPGAGDNPTPVTGNPEVDAWWAKKGFKSTEDMAHSYRELERELHKRAQDARDKTPTPPAAPPPGWGHVPPGYAPPPVYAGYPPPYAPPTYVPPRQVIEDLAGQYAMSPEDFERVSRVASDMAERIVERKLNGSVAPLANHVRNMDREVARNRDMVTLMADPAFKNPQVQFEMHRILEENPQLIEREALPYRYAYDQALLRIAKASLAGSTSIPNGNPPGSPQPKPPTMAGGNGAGGGGAPSDPGTGRVDEAAFAAMTLEQKRAHLKSVGAM